jgi:cbb3-type cytochrome oxidase subunit 3
MKNMLKLLVVPALIVMPFLKVLPVHAQDISSGLSEVGGKADLASTSLTEVIGTLINVFLTLLGIIFLILVLYAGYLWMTAAGNEKNVEKAKDIMIRAVIGLIIILAAYSISSFVITALTNAGLAGTAS